MSQVCAADGEGATKVVAKSFRGAEGNYLELAVSNSPGKFLPTVRAVMQRVQTLWKIKPTAQLSYLTGATDRTCRNWLNGEGDIPGSAIIALLHTEHGPAFLAEIMARTNAKWFARMEADRKLAAQSRKRFAEDRSKQQEFLFDE